MIFRIFPDLGELVSMSSTPSASSAGDVMHNWTSIHGRVLLYVPNDDYFGSDSFCYTAVVTNIPGENDSDTIFTTAVNTATVDIAVASSLLIPELDFSDGITLSMNSFSVMDDAWETDTPLSVTLRVSSDEVAFAQSGINVGESALDANSSENVGHTGDINALASDISVRLSLATTQGLQFNAEGGSGDGSSDVIASFRANELQSTAAMKRLDIDISQMDIDQESGEMSNVKDFSLEIDVEDNDPSDSLTTSLEVPVNLMFSSVPLIREIYPTILLSYGASNVSSAMTEGPKIDITADKLGHDVKMCSVGGILVPITRLSQHQVRCEVPVQLLVEVHSTNSSS